MDNEEFIRLEQLVDTLIEKYRDLKGKYRILEESLQESERECDVPDNEVEEAVSVLRRELGEPEEYG
ncbi:MAG: hypothetical protein D3907_06270, partial [Candidatus Electrothrix sp. AUS3]|nr:hypothetical protein [Candidatus Electrothrix gigas]